MLAGAAPAQSDNPAPLSTIVVEGARVQSPGISSKGTNDYRITSEDIADLPAGENTC
jgi:hypothetical protein